MIASGRRLASDERSRIAIVTPWFGAGLRGGAEQQSRELAAHFASDGYDVDVLTTCCTSFHDDWQSNALRAGAERSGEITIRRFRTDKRDRRAFERVNGILLGIDNARLRRSVSPVGDADAETFARNSINSTALNAYLEADGSRYDRILFLPYMFGTTLFGLPLVAERAYLQPCLHREAYAFLPRVAATFHAARGLLFNSDAERDLAVSLYGPGIIAKSFVVGEGVDPLDADRLPARIHGFMPDEERYVLYIGRRDPAKNIGTLVAAFKAFRRAAPASRLKLVLSGEGSISYADSAAGIVDLGCVSEPEKSALLRGCRALAQPSTVESYSRVIYEAWRFARPVIVHGDCPATVSAVNASGGGYLADSTLAWENALHRIEHDADATLAALGARGAVYARQASSWATVVERYRSAFTAQPTSVTEAPASLRWNEVPDAPLAAALADGKTNLLYAGTLGASDTLADLVDLFVHLLTIDRDVRLTIALTGDPDAAAFDALSREARRLDLGDRLIVARDLTSAQWQAIYLGADLFVSLDPEAAGARELESALWFDIPIVALATPATRNIAGGGAILVDDTSDLLAIAALVEIVARDPRLREAVVAGQRAVRDQRSKRSA